MAKQTIYLRYSEGNVPAFDPGEAVAYQEKWWLVSMESRDTQGGTDTTVELTLHEMPSTAFLTIDRSEDPKWAVGEIGTDVRGRKFHITDRRITTERLTFIGTLVAAPDDARVVAGRPTA